jgi:PBP1b-binding outer membrane lipoprotein LpoB
MRLKMTKLIAALMTALVLAGCGAGTPMSVKSRGGQSDEVRAAEMRAASIRLTQRSRGAD